MSARYRSTAASTACKYLNVFDSWHGRVSVLNLSGLESLNQSEISRVRLRRPVWDAAGMLLGCYWDAVRLGATLGLII